MSTIETFILYIFVEGVDCWAVSPKEKPSDFHIKACMKN